MNISVIISTILIAQVSASFFDVFQGAVLSVQNSVGKLISDVAFDVRETVDCTILAVEHVLSLSDDATSRYYDKCGSGKNKTDSENNALDNGGVPKVEVSLQISNNEEDLRKEIPAEIDARINETLKKVLGSYDPHENLLSVQNVLAKESEQLADVSGLVKQELEKLTNEVNSDFKNSKEKKSEPSVDTILQEINLLENREKITKNTSEANEIHKIVDEVLGKLDVIEATEATENLKLEEILKDLEKNSNNTFVGLRQQFEEWKEEESRHLDEIKNKMEEHEKNAKHSKHKRKSNHMQPVDLIGKRNNDDMKSPKIKGKSLLYPETVQQASKDETEDDSNEIPFSEIPNSTQNIKTASPTNIASTNNEKDMSEPSLNTQDKNMFDSPITSIMTDKNEKSSILTTIAPNTLKDNVIMNTPFSITESLSKTVMAHHIESTMDNTNEESSTLITNESTTTLNVLNVHDSNDTSISSTPLPITRSAPDSEIIHTVESTTYSEKDELHTSTTNKPTASPNTVNDSDLDDTVIRQTPLKNVKLNDTVVESTAYAVIENTLLSVTVNPNENTTYSENDESSTTSAEILARVPTILNNDSNDTSIRNTSSQIIVSTTVSETIQPVESTTEEPSVSKANNDDSNDTMITSMSIPLRVITAVIETTQPIETTNVPDNEEPSTLTANKPTTTRNLAIDDDSNDTTIMTTSSPVKSDIAVTGTNESVETITVSVYEEPSDLTINKPTTFSNTENKDYSNDTLITSTSSPIKATTAVIETTQPIETTNISDNEEPSTLTTNKPTNTPNIAIDNDLNDTVITSTSSPIKSNIAITETNEPIETTTVSRYEEPSALTINKPTTLSTTENEDDLNDAMVTSNSSPVKVTIAVETTQPIETTNVSSNENPLILTTNIPTTSRNTVIETTTVSEVDIQEENTTATGSVDPSILSIDLSSTLRNTLKDNDSNGNLITSTESTQSTITSEMLQIPLHENENNDIVMAGTFPITTSFVITESSYDSENITLDNSPTTPSDRDRGNFFLNDQYLNNNILTKSQRFTITKSPIPLLNRSIIPDNRKWLAPSLYKKTPNIFNHQNYIPNDGLKNENDSIRDRILKTNTSLITKGVTHESHTTLKYGKSATPPKLYNQQPSSSNRALYKYPDVDESLDSIRKRILETGTPFIITKSVFNDISTTTPMNVDTKMYKGAFEERDSVINRVLHNKPPLDIPKSTAEPTVPVIRDIYTPRRPLNPEKPNNMDTSKQIIGPRYSLDLTTHKPVTTVSRKGINYKNAPLDLDSFFHIPQKNSDAHDRALKEALELIKNSKRSERIINSILKNKNSNGRRSIFNNP